MTRGEPNLMKTIGISSASLLIALAGCPRVFPGLASLGSGVPVVVPKGLNEGLVCHLKLKGDCLDHSGNNNHGINRGVRLEDGSFDGRGAHVEIPATESLQPGRGDFTISAWVHTEPIVNDTLGDVASWFDPDMRRGVNLGLHSSSGGYQSTGDDRRVSFGIDDHSPGRWHDCGRPSATSNYVSNSLTVFDGQLYAGIMDAKDESGWCHVYRHNGGKEWIDCGRVGTGRTTGVMALIVHKGKLYAGTSTYDWTRVFSGKHDPARVYRYEGGTTWTDCGQPGQMLRINCMASFGGRLYLGGDRGLPPPGEKQWTGRPYQIYVHDGGTKWSVAGTFPPEPPRSLYPHAMAVHDGRLYAGYPNVFAFDGRAWEFAGTPLGKTPVDLKPDLQVHSLSVFRGKLVAGMWPEARVVEYGGGQRWEDRGRMGDGTEINALCVYNGKLHAGAIPRGEVSRYDDSTGWTSLRKFFSPPDWNPGPATAPVRAEINNWTRVTSLTVFQGKLFASIGSCTGSVLDAPADIRGSVHSWQAGPCVSCDRDIGHGWRHLTAIRQGGELRLYVDGLAVARSEAFEAASHDLTLKRPLLVGFGQHDYFTGKIRDFRLHRRAVKEEEITAMHKQGPS